MSNSEGFDSHSDSLVMAVLALVLVAFVVVEYAAAGVGDFVGIVASVAVVAEVVPAESGEFLYVWSNVSAKPRRVRVKGEEEGGNGKGALRGNVGSGRICRRARNPCSSEW